MRSPALLTAVVSLTFLGGAGLQAGAKTPPAAPTATTEAQGYTYRRDGHRDPFVSLLATGTDTKSPVAAGARPAGLAGLSASEVALKGTMQSGGGYVALLKGADNRTYVVRAGDRLFDGTIRTITADAMVIVQRVSDPLSRQKEREVRKTLRQTDEVK